MDVLPVWQVAPDRALSLDQPRLMGVLNVTPDSFSDGGAFGSVSDAVNHGLRLVDEGACVVDVGGESSRPGARRVTPAEQIDRTAPVIEALRRRCDVLISIDTTRHEVAEAALDAGAQIINDVAAGTEDPALLDLAARRGCGLVLMHRLVAPEADSFSDRYEREPVYDDVVAAVRGFLLDRCEHAMHCGVAPASIVIDPGLGFGKSVRQNYRLIGGTRSLLDTGFPVLSAASRKSFLGAVTGAGDPQRRQAGSTAVSVIHWILGVRLFRVHDVAAHREALQVAAAVDSAAPQPV